MIVRFASLRDSLLAVALLTAAISVAAQPVEGGAPTAAEETFTVNFKEGSQLEEVVRYVARATGKTIVIDPKTKGQVQVISSQPLTRVELYDLFLSILEVNGFTAVEAGNVVKIIPSRDARSAGAPVTSGGRESSEIVTEVIQLQNVSAATLIPVLRPLAPQQAHMAAYGPSNAIIVSDTSVNIARIREVIARIDKAAIANADVVRLQHASADEMVRMLEQLEKAGSPQGQPEAKTLTLVADKRTNSVLVSGDDMQRARIRALIRNLDAPLAQSGNARVVYLQYAKAKDMAEVLNKVLQNVEKAAPGQAASGGAQGKAAVEADEGTNSLIITAPADVMSSLMGIVSRLDIRRAQVLVEAIIVEMNADNGRDLGVQWLFLNDSGAYGSSSIDNGLNASTAAAALGKGVDDDGNVIDVDPTAALSQVLGSTTGQVLGIGRVGSDFSFNVVLNALQQDSNANILSTPSLLTLDNEEASIVVGQNVPFLTGSYTSTGTGTSTPGNPFQTIERENVGITLKVTPHINEGDSLVLEIVQEVSSLTGAASQVNASDVITNERKIETKVLADNGQTIVLGGLIQDDVQETETKVPFLGDIPGIGRLFRSNSTRKIKQHLMVFLRPMIVRDGRELAGATGEKYRYMRDLQVQERIDGVEFLREDQLPLLPEWQEQLDRIRELENSRVLDLSAPNNMTPPTDAPSSTAVPQP